MKKMAQKSSDLKIYILPIARFFYYEFPVGSQKYRKILIFFLFHISSTSDQIWLNHFGDDSHLSYITKLERETLHDGRKFGTNVSQCVRFTRISPKFKEEEEDLAKPLQCIAIHDITSVVQHVCINYEHGLSDKLLLMLTSIYIYIYIYIYICFWSVSIA
jgi:hypothetical protein